MFCPKCGSILIPKREGDKTIIRCGCGYKSEDKEAGKFTEVVKGKTRRVGIVDTEDDLNALPKMKAECPKCHNQEAAYWEVQTRAADEPATKFLKCTKCKRIWRDYN